MSTMDLQSSAKDTQIQTSLIPDSPTVNPQPQPQLELPSTDSSAATVINIPAYSGWFSCDSIHPCELRFLPEFFDSRSPSKNARLYIYYRNSILNMFRLNPSRRLTFTEARKTLVGDVGSVRRVFDFLETWGLINYTGVGPKQSFKWEEKDSKATGGDPSLETSFPTRRWCSGCKSLCSIACFASDKHDLTLCARCYVRGNYQAGVISSDFRRVEINEEVRSEWTEKETLHLLEAVVHYGDDWKKVVDHVAGRSEKECVSHFLKLSFGEEFLGYGDHSDVNQKFYQVNVLGDTELEHEGSRLLSPSKRMRLTPLVDASNPIMAQAAFLAALVGVNASVAAARAAVTAMSDANLITLNKSYNPFPNNSGNQENDAKSNGDNTFNELQEVHMEAEAQLEKEELDMKSSISGLTDGLMNEIQDKIIHFEEFDVQIEKERERLQQTKNLLFGDRLSLLLQTRASAKIGEGRGLE